MPEIDYYISLNSPWTYFGSKRLAALATAHGARVNIKPMRIGEVFSNTGGLPLPKRAPERQAYRMAELKRWSAYLGMPIVYEPKVFPFDETEGVRLVLGAQKLGLDAQALATEIGRALWEYDQDGADEAALAGAAERAGLDIDALRAAISVEEAKEIWAKNTQDAVAQGVFGAPSYVVGGEIFWGQDRLDFVGRKLAAMEEAAEEAAEKT